MSGSSKSPCVCMKSRRASPTVILAPLGFPIFLATRPPSDLPRADASHHSRQPLQTRLQILPRRAERESHETFEPRRPATLPVRVHIEELARACDHAVLER